MTGRCDGCQRDPAQLIETRLCAACFEKNAEKIQQVADVKLRLAGDIDWTEVEEFGVYDRNGVPIGTVRKILHADANFSTNVAYQMMSTTPSVLPSLAANPSEVLLAIRPLRKAANV